MRTVHRMRRSLARLARRTRVALKRRHAARPLPPPDAEPAAIAQALMAHAAGGVAGGDPRAIDALCEESLAHHAGDEAVTAAAARWYLATGRPERVLLVCEGAFGQNAAGIARVRAVQAAWGEALLVLDRVREAVWRLESACGLEEAAAEDWANLARAYCRCGRYDEALAAGERAACRPWARPEAADDAMVTMATALYCLGRMDASERMLEELLARVPRHADARRMLNKVRNFMGKGEAT